MASLIARRGPNRIAKRILSPEEVKVWQALPVTVPSDTTQFFAVRFSVKEAAYKALSPIIRPTWKELCYRSSEEGAHGSKPSIHFHPLLAKDREKVGSLHVSVSHDGEYVATTVIAERPVPVPVQ